MLLNEQKITKKRPPHRFVKGQSGNPKGRPKGTLSVMETTRRELEKNPELLVAIVKRWIDRMLEGKNFAWFKEFIDRLDGKVPDKQITATTNMTSLTPDETAILMDELTTGVSHVEKATMKTVDGTERIRLGRDGIIH